MIPTVLTNRFRTESFATDLEFGCFRTIACHDISTWKQHTVLICRPQPNRAHAMQMQLMPLLAREQVLASGMQDDCFWAVLENHRPDHSGSLDDLK